MSALPWILAAGLVAGFAHLTGVELPRWRPPAEIRNTYLRRVAVTLFLVAAVIFYLARCVVGGVWFGLRDAVAAFALEFSGVRRDFQAFLAAFFWAWDREYHIDKAGAFARARRRVGR